MVLLIYCREPKPYSAELKSKLTGNGIAMFLKHPDDEAKINVQLTRLERKCQFVSLIIFVMELNERYVSYSVG